MQVSKLYLCQQGPLTYGPSSTEANGTDRWLRIL